MALTTASSNILNKPGINVIFCLITLSESSSNPSAIELLKNNKDKINWGSLSNNQAAIELLKEKLIIIIK
jgi:hypothetical protein